MFLDAIPEGRYAVIDRRDPARIRVQIYRVTGTPEVGLKIHAEYRRRKRVLVARWSEDLSLRGVGGSSGASYEAVAEVFAAPTTARLRYSRMERLARCAGLNCGRTLTDHESIAAGLGPECRRKLAARVAA